MNDRILRYKLRKIKRRIDKRHCDDEDFEEKHPRAGEGAVNAQGKKNGGQFISKQEQESQRQADFDPKDFEDYKNVTQASIDRDSAKMILTDLNEFGLEEAKKLYATRDWRKEYGRGLFDALPDGWKVNISCGDGVYEYYNEGDDSCVKNLKTGEVSKSSDMGKDELYDKITGIVESGVITASVGEQPPVNEYGFGGYYDANNGGKDIKNFSPNPSFLCMVAPDITKKVDATFDAIKSEGTRYVLNKALSDVRVNPTVTEEWQDARNYYDPFSNRVFLSGDYYLGYRARTVIHESTHYFDFGVVGSTGDDYLEMPFSVRYKNGAFLRAFKTAVGAYLDKFNYSDSSNMAVIRDAITADLVDNGISRDSIFVISDMIDAYTNGKLNLGAGHSSYAGHRWNDESISAEAYADTMESLQSDGKNGVEYAFPQIMQTFNEMNSDIMQWQSNPLSKYIRLPAMLNDYSKPNGLAKRTFNSVTSEIKSLKKKAEESPESSSQLLKTAKSYAEYLPTLVSGNITLTVKPTGKYAEKYDKLTFVRDSNTGNLMMLGGDELTPILSSEKIFDDAFKTITDIIATDCIWNNPKWEDTTKLTEW